MVYHFEVTEIEIVEDPNAFTEWCNASEEQRQDDIDRWEDSYFAELKKAIGETYPTARVSVETGRDNQGQHVTLKRVDSETEHTIDIDGNDDSDGWGYSYSEIQAEEQVKQQLTYIFDDVSNAGKFWD